ncbi:hypothetical protein RJT34_17621 [Clitoria ternatea]|uniref:Uncharacterized protein n=1 Tax=Clitoria ternatea TaxID=43366 RepID=A0AAN9PDX7_CLITE
MPTATNSTHFTSTRDQVVNLLKELQDIFDKRSTLVFAFAAMNTDKGKSMFEEHHEVMMCLVVTIVVYSLLGIIGTMLKMHGTKFLPIITCAMLVVGSAVSVQALSFISSTIAWITLALWVGVFTLVAHDYGVPQRIKNWIKGLMRG